MFFKVQASDLHRSIALMRNIVISNGFCAFALNSRRNICAPTKKYEQISTIGFILSVFDVVAFSVIGVRLRLLRRSRSLFDQNGKTFWI